MDTETTKLPIEENLTAEELREPEKLAQFIVAVLDSKRAKGIKLLHVEKQTVIADYFVVCTGNSRTQIRALADEVEFKLSGYGISPSHTEGAEYGCCKTLTPSSYTSSHPTDEISISLRSSIRIPPKRISQN